MEKLILAILLLSPIYGAELTLSFTDNSDNEKGFIVERSVGSLPFEQLMTLEADVTEFVDEDVPLGTSVSWRVYAWNDYGDSGFTNVVAELTSPPLGPKDLKIKKPNPLARFFKKHKRKRS